MRQDARRGAARVYPEEIERNNGNFRQTGQIGELGRRSRCVKPKCESRKHQTTKPYRLASRYSSRSRTLNSSFHRCLPSRLWHHSSSVPTSVTLLCKCTGTARPALPSSVVEIGASSSI